MNHQNFSSFHVLKASEGGTAQSALKAVAKANGFSVTFSPSFYVGHYTVSIPTVNRRKVGQFERKVLGWR